MPPEPFEYAVLRVTPRVERGELVNVGVVVFCRTRSYLGVKLELGERQLAALRALEPDLQVSAIRAHLDSIRRVAAGGDDAGPIAKLAAPERFRWLSSPSSTMIQPSDVHGGLTDDPAVELKNLFDKLVSFPD
ncbi:MAG TPA: DUF3037 domain-containing protein [Candidatus Limnocylindrales bacterium]|nr:DUF3037 domain-containing protein [Candidatus Limnocylindrales bacterium]